VSSKLIAAGCLAGGLALAGAGWRIIRLKDAEHPNPPGMLAMMGAVVMLILGLVLAIVLAPMFYSAS
jgi:hypothetical protein